MRRLRRRGWMLRFRRLLRAILVLPLLLLGHEVRIETFIFRRSSYEFLVRPGRKNGILFLFFCRLCCSRKMRNLIRN
jgi:hypothetical protein